MLNQKKNGAYTANIYIFSVDKEKAQLNIDLKLSTVKGPKHYK